MFTDDIKLGLCVKSLSDLVLLRQLDSLIDWFNANKCINVTLYRCAKVEFILKFTIGNVVLDRTNRTDRTWTLSTLCLLYQQKSRIDYVVGNFSTLKIDSRHLTVYFIMGFCHVLLFPHIPYPSIFESLVCLHCTYADNNGPWSSRW